jgi:hypothetical protein
MTPAPAPCVVPVAALDALAWARGQLNDEDLLFDGRLVPEAVFILSLRDLQGPVSFFAGWKAAARQMLYWRKRGAVCMITRSSNPIVQHHMEANGWVAGITEGQGTHASVRYFAPPEAFAKWCARVSRLCQRGAERAPSTPMSTPHPPPERASQGTPGA